MKRFSKYLIVYDITSDKERARVNKILIGYGIRVQKSVFECKLNKGLKANLTKKLEDINIKTGHISFYRIAGNSKKTNIGNRPYSADDDYVYIV